MSIARIREKSVVEFKRIFAHLAKQLGEYWQNTITKRDGMYYNCNAHKSQ